MTEKTVSVPNISCGHCVATIEREVADLEGVASVSADQTRRSVTVAWRDDVTDWATVGAFMAEIGYPPSD